MLRALSLVDVLAQLQQDSGEQIAFNPNEVINALTVDAETLRLTGETLTATTITNYPLNLIQDAGPLGYWRFDDPAASTTVFDSSPWNTAAFPKVPGTVVGGVTFQTTGAMPGSKGVTLNGTTGYIEVANTASMARTFDLTVEVWFKAASLAAAQVLVSKGATGEYHLILNTNGSVSLLMGPSYNTVVVPAAAVTAGTWFHLAVTRRAIDKTIAAYLNGTSRFTGTYTTAPTATVNPVRWGAVSGGAAASFFSGVLDEAAIYSLPLTPAQVAKRWQWAQAADCGSTAYGTTKYGGINYPLPGPPSGSIYGDPSTLYGGATYA